MRKSQKPTHSLKEILEKTQQKGLHIIKTSNENNNDSDNLLPLNERIKKILNIIKSTPLKSREMLYFIMYDIESDKVRREIAKYLIRQGAIRIQKSVYLIKHLPSGINKIYHDLKEVQSLYDNQDSIIISPVEVSSIKSMKLIGKEINIEILIDKPNTLFL